MEDNMKNRAIVAGIGIALTVVATLAYSVHVHLTESMKRKHLRRVREAWAGIQATDWYQNSPPEDKLAIHDAFFAQIKK